MSRSGCQVEASNLETGFIPIVGTLLLLGVPSLSFCQLLFIPGRELRIAVGLTVARDNHTLESQVKPYLLIDAWQVFDIFFYQVGDKVAVSTIFGDSDGRRFASFR